MISRETFELVRKKHGRYASWAVWADFGKRPKDNVGDLSIFDDADSELLNQLRVDVVLVGLNISRALLAPFRNFHDDRSQSQDYKLRYALKSTILWGAYMTDIIKDFEEKESGKLRTYLRANKDFEADNVDRFREELADLGSERPTLVALGNESLSILKRNFLGDYDVRVIPHYSQHMNKECYREQVEAEILGLDLQRC